MIKGIDVSHWQGEMNWPKAKSAGAEFAFIRAGSIDRYTGECYWDYQFHRNAEMGPEYMPCAYYWYFRPKWDAEKQIDYFLGLLQPKKKFGGVMDFEICETTKAIANSRAWTFMDRMAKSWDLKSIVYSRAYFLNDWLNEKHTLGKYDLWIARYHPLLTHPWGDGYCKPNGWDDWKFWQWSADGNGQGPTYGGNSSSMDLNRFNGSLTDFRVYLGEEVQKPIYQIGVPATVGDFIIEVNRT